MFHNQGEFRMVGRKVRLSSILYVTLLPPIGKSLLFSTQRCPSRLRIDGTVPPVIVQPQPFAIAFAYLFPAV